MTLDRLHVALRSSFVRADVRVVHANVDGWTATAIIDTSHRGGPIRASELLALAEALGVDPSGVTVWDHARERCEISIDLDERTPVDNPRRATNADR